VEERKVKEQLPKFFIDQASFLFLINHFHLLPEDSLQRRLEEILKFGCKSNYQRIFVCRVIKLAKERKFSSKTLSLIQKLKKVCGVNEMRLIERLNNLLLEIDEANWVNKVKPKWHPPEGLFTKDPETIAKTVAKASKDYKQAVARVNFFYNRYGCSGDRKGDPICKKRTRVLQLLRKIFKKTEEEATKVIITYDGDTFDVVYPSGSVESFSDEASFLQFVRDKKVKGKNGMTDQQLVDWVKDAGYIEAILGK